MEGKYTKAGTIIGLVGLLIALWSLVPKSSNNIAGEWLMTSKVDAADLSAYVGAEIQWKMFITENQNTVKGTAEKVKINGEELDYKQRTSLEFEGVVDGNNLVINYIENGKARKTSGIIKVKLEDERFYGNFSQTASSAKGSITAEKIK